MTKPIIELKKVTKMYGKERGVLDISLDIPKGSVYGFLGPNGAGKTTTISMLIDLIHPTKGDIKIFGLDAQKNSLKIRQKLGFLGGDMALDESLTGLQQLEYFGHIHKNFDKKYIRELAGKLNCDLSRKIKSLSRGNRQKVGLISALMHKPELLILDEPTSGLDPLIQDEFNSIINEHKKQGKTVFISSHILSEVEILCDHVAFVREGELIADKPIEQITSGLPKHVKIVTKSTKLVTQLEKLPAVSHIKVKNSSIVCHFLGDINTLIKLLSADKVDDISITPPDLDTIFTKFYEE
jgi:ABC-2 type transport system ATP-binding protein